MKIDETLKNFLIERGYHPLLGARPLKKLIEKRIISTLALGIVKNKIEVDAEVILMYNKDNDTVIFLQSK